MQLQEERLDHILLIYRKMIPSVMLCGHCQLEYLAQEKRLEYRAMQEQKLSGDDLNWADIVFLGRLDSWYEYQLARKLHEAGKYLIYIIDDDLLNIPPEISSAAYYGQKKIQAYIRKMVEMSDAILSPSPLLLEKYAVQGHRAIQIEEPAIDPVAYKPHEPGKPVKIGFAGSIDRREDIEKILKDALIRIKREYGDAVQFEFFGAIPSFAKALDANCIPYYDSYDTYRKTLNGLAWDIGLAPMPDKPFHACKHYNKFVEYAAAGIVGVYSDVGPYKKLRKFRGAQVLCGNSTQEWYESIRFLMDEESEREAYRQNALSFAWNDLSVEATAKMLEENLRALAKERPASPNKTISLKDIRHKYFIYHIKEKIEAYGVYGCIKRAFGILFGRLQNILK